MAYASTIRPSFSSADRTMWMSSSGYSRMYSAGAAYRLTPESLSESMPNFFAAARIFGIARSPNGDCGARDRASLVCAASWTGKCRSDRGTVRPEESFLPPGSMYANASSGRSLMLCVLISARVTPAMSALPACSILACVAG